MVKTALEITPGANWKVVLAGLANVYTHYITTHEEYQQQRYEAASTIYGPHTLRAYQDQYTLLTKAILQVNSIDQLHFDISSNFCAGLGHTGWNCST